MKISKVSRIEQIEQMIKLQFKIDLNTQNAIYLNLNKFNQVQNWVRQNHHNQQQDFCSFFYAKVYNAKALYLGWNDCPKIVNIIQQSIFLNMKELTLNGNQLVSIQNLQNVMLPNLSSFQICTNFIEDFSTLRKCNFNKNFTKILLVQNIFNSFQKSFKGLTQLRIKQCQTLIISFRDDCYKNTLLQTHQKFYQSLIKMQADIKWLFTTPHTANDRFIRQRFNIQAQLQH